MARSDRQLFDALSQTPFVDSAELAGILGEPHSTVHRALTGLLADGIIGNVRLKRIPNIQRDTLHQFIDETVRDEKEAIYTDELAAYLGIKDHNTRHETVNHSIEQWVVGDVHTNTIEGVWSLFKRSIVGAFHKISEKHLDRYLEELEWRYSNRDNDHIFVDTLKRIVNTEHLTYEELTAA